MHRAAPSSTAINWFWCKTMPQTIAITGTTGFVGSNFLNLAVREGYQLRALTRRPQDARPRVEWIEGSLSDPDSLLRLADGADALVHIAGVVNAPDRAGFETGNVAGTLAVVEAAKKMGIRRFVHVSSLAASHPDLSIYGETKAKAEKIIGTSGLDWTIVRPPAIYGPGDREMLDLFKMAKMGFILLPPDTDGKLSAIHVHDLVRFLLRLTRQDEDMTSQIYEIDDGAKNGWTHKSFATAIGLAVGKRVAAIGMPRFALEIGAVLDRALRHRKAKLTKDRISYFCHKDWTIDAKRRPPADIWQPEIETRVGLKQTATWYRSNEWL